MSASMVATVLLSVPVDLPSLQEEVEQKLCLERIPTQKNPGVLNQAIVVPICGPTTSNPSNHRATEVRSNLATLHEWNAIWRFE